MSDTEVVSLLIEDSLGNDLFDPVGFAMKKKGMLPAREPSGKLQCGPATLSKVELTEVANLAKRFTIGEIECYLAADWQFDTLMARAWRLPAHAKVTMGPSNLSHLRVIALELEDSLFRTHNTLSNTDIFRFWASFQVHRHISVTCDKLFDRPHDPITIAKTRFLRWLGSYAYAIRNICEDSAEGLMAPFHSHSSHGNREKLRGFAAAKHDHQKIFEAVQPFEPAWISHVPEICQVLHVKEAKIPPKWNMEYGVDSWSDAAEAISDGMNGVVPSAETNS